MLFWQQLFFRGSDADHKWQREGHVLWNMRLHVPWIRLENPTDYSTQLTPSRHLDGFKMRKFASIAILTTSFFFLLVIYNQVISKFKPAPVNSKSRKVNVPNANDKEANVSERLDEPSVEVNFWYSDSKDGKDSQSLIKSTSAEVQTTAATPVQPRSTASSFLGDWYPTDITNLQSQCSESARSRLAKVDEYKGIFLGTVPVLQWSKHVTEEAYQRLKRYNGAHGWSVISYEDLKDTLRYLNTSANAVLFDDWEQRANKSSACIRCAVIGNGGILNGSRKGREIDGHDYVFRVNGAIIKGYEQDVGTRTSFYTFSTNTMKNSLHAYHHMGFTGLPHSEETRYIFVPDHDRDYYLVKAAITNATVEKGKDKSQRPQDIFGGNVKPEKFKMYHPDFIRYIRNRFLKANILNSPHRNIYRPTTGATMLMAAIHSCDQVHVKDLFELATKAKKYPWLSQVSAYGFMTEDYAKYSDHYFDRIYHKVVFYSNHDMRLEMRLWKKLNDHGIIKLYTRQNKQR